MTDNELIDRLMTALHPIQEFIRVNDGDSLSGLTPDHHVIGIASGSWHGPVKLTPDDLRRIDHAARGCGSW